MMERCAHCQKYDDGLSARGYCVHCRHEPSEAPPAPRKPPAPDDSPRRERKPSPRTNLSTSDEWAKWIIPGFLLLVIGTCAAIAVVGFTLGARREPQQPVLSAKEQIEQMKQKDQAFREEREESERKQLAADDAVWNRVRIGMLEAEAMEALKEYHKPGLPDTFVPPAHQFQVSIATDLPDDQQHRRLPVRRELFQFHRTDLDIRAVYFQNGRVIRKFKTA